MKKYQREVEAKGGPEGNVWGERGGKWEGKLVVVLLPIFVTFPLCNSSH